MNKYLEQVHCQPADIDLDFWRYPEGVSVPDDELRFLLIPDSVEALATFAVARQVHEYQQAATAGEGITTALMATMGGLLPGILLHDHLARLGIRFGSIGVSLYKGPDERHPSPRVQQPCSVPVQDEVVLLVDDLGDRGDTLKFLSRFVTEQGARQVLSLVIYMKPRALEHSPADFYFGEVPQDTWIITPRELVETMASRVPVWKQRGADAGECRRRLVDLIGYPSGIVDYYLPGIFNAD